MPILTPGVAELKYEPLDPTGWVSHNDFPNAERLETLENCTVGIVDNGKPNGRAFFDALSKMLKRDWGVRDVVIARKPSVSLPASELIMQRLRIHTHAIITGIGD